MLYEITGEQPFQVLSDSFTISPSESGYDLYISADGINYSQFITVAANTTKQMVDMNNGNYYRLMGNTSTVTVNWNRDCHGGGGGGTAGVSSLDGQTGALTTKTINGNAILGSGDIVISGSSSDSNYVVVDALSAITNPVEGMIAYIPAHSETFTGFSIESSQVAYQAQLKKSAPRDITYTISTAYSIGTDNNASSSFYFDSGNWTPIYRKNVWLQYDDASQKTKIVCRDGYTVECSLSQEYYEAITTSFTVDEQVFIYKNNKWYPFEDGKVSFYLNNVNTQAKWTDFINEINRLVPGSFQYVYDWYDFNWITIKFNTLSKPQYSDGSTDAYGTSYLFKASNGETFDVLNAYSLRVSDNAGWKSIDLATQAGVPIASDSTLGGIKVGSGLTIDGNGVLSVSGGSSSGPTIIDFDAMSQAERANLYNELHNTTSADTVNENYAFYKTFNDGSTGPFRVQLVNSDYYGRIIFSAAWLNPYDDNRIMAAKVWIDGNGNFEVENLQTIHGAPARSTDTVGYFDTYTNPIIFDQTTSAFTNNDSTLTNGSRFGGSFYWFIVNPYDGNWGIGIPVLGLKIIDTNNEATIHYYPSTSTKSITTVTVDGVDYDKEFTANYGKYTFKMLLNSTPQGANFQMIQNY